MHSGVIISLSLMIFYLFEFSSVEQTVDGGILHEGTSSALEKRYLAGYVNRMARIGTMRQKLRKLYNAYPRLGLKPNKAYQKMMSKPESFIFKTSSKPNGFFGIGKSSPTEWNDQMKPEQWKKEKMDIEKRLTSLFVSLYVECEAKIKEMFF